MVSRQSFSPTRVLLAILCSCSWAAFAAVSEGDAGREGGGQGERRPNILIAISDDQSYPHASAYGFEGARTPAFDQVAASGALFHNAFAASPGCSPSRAAILTGRYPWSLKQAGTHASSFPSEFTVFPDLLEESGYFVGYTGKGWGPGNWRASGRERNPAGPLFSGRRNRPPFKGISANDYAANFADFLEKRPRGQPFYFWYGASEPHRSYEKGAGLESGKELDDAQVPAFLPETPEVRSDMLDYFVEIEWFDRHLGRMLRLLEEAGELENTLVIVTSDNGMPFPRAKANVYEYGIHMPLAVAWPERIPSGQVVRDLVSLVDIAPTALEASGVEGPPMHGRSWIGMLTAGAAGDRSEARRAVFSSRERHSSSRYRNRGYPQRALRSERYLYIRNFHPERWPAGPGQKFDRPGTLGAPHGAYHDIDGCPTLDFLVDRRNDPQMGKFLEWAAGKRPRVELFDVLNDPACLNNLASDPALAATRGRLESELEGYLRETGDPRMGPDPEIWETYPRYSPIRSFPAPRDESARDGSKGIED